METDWQKHALRGSIKSVIVEIARFEWKAGQLTEKLQSRDTMTFNQDGWLTEQTTHNSDGFESRTVSDYSDSHKLLGTRLTWGSFVREVRYIYDGEERLVAEQHVSLDGKVTTPITYAYDDAGLKVKIEELDYDEEASLMVGIEGTIFTINAGDAQRIETRYDDRDKEVEVKVFNSAGSLTSRIEITRDARGKPLEATQYHGDVVRFGPGSSSTEEIEALTEEQKAEFAAAVAQFFSPGTAVSRHTHQYDVEGRLIESKLTMMGMAISRQTFSYDEAGNKAEEVSHDENAPGENKAIFKRDYDEQGNWTKELFSTVSSWDAEFGLSTPVHVTRRTITYYT